MAFPADGSKRGVLEAARAIKLNQATAYRYIVALTELGLLERDQKSREYGRVQLI